MRLQQILSKFTSIQKVIIAPLNWGLGHATRCVPIINWFLTQKIEVIIATDGLAKIFLEEEYPQLQIVELPGYNIKYSKLYTGVFTALQAAKIASAARKENAVIAQLCDKVKPDLLLSDNRLGAYHAEITSIFLSHQINPLSPIPGLGRLVKWINHQYISNYDACWIPDFPDRSLSGMLSLPWNGIETNFIGPLSRLHRVETDLTLDIAIILSGPEPQRSILEQILHKLLEQTTHKGVLIRGTKNPSTVFFKNTRIKVYDLLGTQSLQQVINQSKLVICRSGYSSIMDLVTLEKQAILIPTPGQTEQEYLGKKLNNHDLFTVISQKELSQSLLDQIDYLLN